jgi:biotin transport system ATP-binding protein
VNSKTRLPLIEARGLGYSFPDGSVGLKSVDLEIFTGEFLILAGRNGSGKSLLMRHLVGLEAPTRGQVLFRGSPLRPALAEARRAIGIVFQDADTQIVGATVEDDLRFGLENLAGRTASRKAGGRSISPAEKEAEIRLKVSRIAEFLGLTSRLNVSAQELSGGEKRRLTIGGILVLAPEVVILDEPFANLDYPGVVSVLRLILELHRGGRGIVLITHELEKALAHAERLVIMEEGRIVDDGPPAEVASRAGRYGLHPLDFSRIPLDRCTWLA